MKNIIIIFLGLAALVTLLIIADKNFDHAPQEFSSESSIWNTEEAPVDSKDENETEKQEETAVDIYDFTVEDINGNLIKKSDVTGKPMVVHFWASWYEYCEYELPALQNTYEIYGDHVSFMVVCITDGEYETLESAKEYLADKEYTFPVYFDTKLEALHNYVLYDFIGTSRTYLFDTNGHYVTKANGTINESTLEEGISMILP